MHTYRLFFPFLNRSVTTFPGPPCLLKDGIYIRTIDDEVYGVIHRQALPVYPFVKNGKTKCVYIDYQLDSEPEKNYHTEFSSRQNRKIRTLLNIVANEGPVYFGPVAVLKISKRLSILNIIKDETPPNLFGEHYPSFRFKPKVTRFHIAHIYKLIDNVCEKYPYIYVTLDRYNSSLTRQNLDDKIIDATIALESLISGKTELRFKFALFLSHIVESNPEQRLIIFDLLKNLYDARSNLVHGSGTKKDIDKTNKIIEQLPKLDSILQRAINYYLFYLQSQDTPDWDTHLKNLIFHFEPRVIE
jgi:hypothetical protein